MNSESMGIPASCVAVRYQYAGMPLSVNEYEESGEDEHSDNEGIVFYDPDENPDQEDYYEKLYAKICGQCHILYSPLSKSADEWDDLVEQKDILMKEKEKWDKSSQIILMTLEDKNDIKEYLKSYGFLDYSDEDLEYMEEEGEKVFKNKCSLCHALPDPVQHVSREWLMIIPRMRKYMRRDGYQDFSEEELENLIVFLRYNSSN